MRRFLRMLVAVSVLIQVLAISAEVLVPAEKGFAQNGAPPAESDEEGGGDAVVQKRTMKGPSEEDVEVSLRRELVYALTLSDGGQYQGTFCPQEVGTIYMVAGAENVVSARETDVYFWPITKEYMANWMETNEKHGGTLEILKAGRPARSLELERYVVRYPQGYGRRATGLLTGKDAEDATRRYQAMVDAYYESMTRYYDEQTRYSELVSEFVENPQAFGGEAPVEPKEPLPPTEYLTGLDDGFIVNLPAGTYGVRLKDEGGNVVPGSERKLVAFPALGEGIGYEIIPEDKWTYPVNSDDASESIFARSKQVIYLKPFTELQYNAHDHAKITQLANPSSGRGMENQKAWVHISPVQEGEVYVEIVRDGKVLSRIQEKAYYVKQRTGYALGYDIVELDAEGLSGEAPSFTAYRIEMPEDAARYYLRAVDGTGNVLEGSVRSLRTTRHPHLAALLVTALLPFALGALVVGSRAVTTGKVSLRRRSARSATA